MAKQESDITWANGYNWEDYRDWPPCPGGSFDLGAFPPTKWDTSSGSVTR
ncbi:MAG: hypothetical protein R3E12_12230 [Candidatus Eisenbacteria bacterium]